MGRERLGFDGIDWFKDLCGSFLGDLVGYSGKGFDFDGIDWVIIGFISTVV